MHIDLVWSPLGTRPASSGWFVAQANDVLWLATVTNLPRSLAEVADVRTFPRRVALWGGLSKISQFTLAEDRFSGAASRRGILSCQQQSWKFHAATTCPQTWDRMARRPNRRVLDTTAQPCRSQVAAPLVFFSFSSFLWYPQAHPPPRIFPTTPLHMRHVRSPATISSTFARPPPPPPAAPPSPAFPSHTPRLTCPSTPRERGRVYISGRASHPCYVRPCRR